MPFQDDLVDAIFRTKLGARALEMAMRNECHTFVGLPEVQRNLELKWTGLIHRARAIWDEVDTEEAHRHQRSSGLERDSAAAADMGVNVGSVGKRRAKPATRLSLRRAHSSKARALPDGQGLAGSGPVNKSTVEIGRIARLWQATGEDYWAMQVLTIVCLPLIALWPPLEATGRASKWPSLLRALDPPPGVRFYSWEVGNLAFLLCMTFLQLPITRNVGDPPRDWFLFCWALAHFARVCSFIALLGIGRFLRDPHNVMEMSATIATVAAMLLNVCNDQDWPAYGDAEMMAALGGHDRPVGDLAGFGQVWLRCDERQAPLAAQEYLAIAVLLRWLNIVPRLTQRSPTFGPLILMTRRMVFDMVQWSCLLVWILLAFSSFFQILHAEPFGTPTAGGEDCDIVPDDDFANFGLAMRILFESVLEGNGHFECMRHASTAYIALPMMYVFLAITVIMLVNMLIAIMAKSFDDIYEQQQAVFLYLKAVQVDVWTHYPPTPPPINLLGLPYNLTRLLIWLIRLPCPKGSHGDAEAAFHMRATHNELFDLPEQWLDENDIDAISEKIVDFSRDDDESGAAGQTAHLLSEVAKLHETLKAEILAELSDGTSRTRPRATIGSRDRPGTPPLASPLRSVLSPRSRGDESRSGKTACFATPTPLETMTDELSHDARSMPPPEMPQEIQPAPSSSQVPAAVRWPFAPRASSGEDDDHGSEYGDGDGSHHHHHHHHRGRHKVKVKHRHDQAGPGLVATLATESALPADFGSPVDFGVDVDEDDGGAQAITTVL